MVGHQTLGPVGHSGFFQQVHGLRQKKRLTGVTQRLLMSIWDTDLAYLENAKTTIVSIWADKNSAHFFCEKFLIKISKITLISSI